MTISRRAECSCGQLSAVCSGEPFRISVCHCLACKRKTGSAFGFGAWFRENEVSTEGHATEFVRVGDDGSRITNRFCPNCGSTVLWTIDKLAGVVAVSAGCFADLTFPPPSVSVYHESRRFPWVEIRAEPLEKRG
jgi:hypothetical protein